MNCEWTDGNFYFADIEEKLTNGNYNVFFFDDQEKLVNVPSRNMKRMYVRSTIQKKLLGAVFFDSGSRRSDKEGKFDRGEFKVLSPNPDDDVGKSSMFCERVRFDKNEKREIVVFETKHLDNLVKKYKHE